MSLKSSFLLVVACGISGYLAEPLIFPNLGVNPKDKTPPVADSKPNESATHSSFSYIDSNKKNEDEAGPATPPTIAAEPVQAIAKHEEQNKVPYDTSDVPAEKPPFPIVSLKLDRYEKSSSTGSPNLDKAIQFAIKNNHFITLRLIK